MAKFDGDPKTVTLEEAKEWLRKEIFESGAPCPCCSQFAKVYRRNFNSSMAYAIIVFAKNMKVGEWTNIPEFLTKGNHTPIIRSREWSRLQNWGLIEASSGLREDGAKESGVYRLTQLGKDFAAGKVEVSEAVYMYDERVLSSDEKKISIRDALGTKFDYAELMGPAVEG